LRALRRIAQAVDVYSRRLAHDYQITGPQLVCLSCIAQEGPITPSAIGRKVHLSSSTMVGILDRLEAKALIVRERGLRDRRQVYIRATDEGQELLNAAPSPLHATLANRLNELPSEEQSELACALEKVVNLMGLDGAHSSSPSEEEDFEARG
jgi:DNA-binding MarR family transcriptional regulator